MPFRRYYALLLAILIFLGFTGCQPASPSPIPATVTNSIPTATMVPMAVLVNSKGITQAEFEAELARYQAAQEKLGNNSPIEQASQVVLDDLINQVLLEQGAQQAGFVVDDEMLQGRIDNLVTQLGSQQALTDWEIAHGYDDASLREALRRQVAVAWMRDQIIAGVPNTAEQVHVQQILLFTQEEAQSVWEQLNTGADFFTLAAIYDPTTRGELGWFPRHYLPYAQIEEAAFALQPGQSSSVVETPAGFSILMVVERDPNHLLSPDAKLTLQTLALENWVAEKRQTSTITLAP